MSGKRPSKQNRMCRPISKVEGGIPVSQAVRKEKFRQSFLDGDSFCTLQPLLDRLHGPFSEAIAGRVAWCSCDMHNPIVGHEGSKFFTRERGTVVSYHFPGQTMSRAADNSWSSDSFQSKLLFVRAHAH